MDLRDYSLSTWSSPVPSKKLDRLYKRSTSVSRSAAPQLHSARDVRERAAAAEEEKKLTALGLQPPHERSPADVRFICGCVSSLVPFFQLWPENLQLELSRVLRTEVLVRQESVLARGTPCTRVVFVLSGKLAVLVPSNNKQRTGDGTDNMVAATLKRGDACGEAALLGNNPMSHADVVVASRGAVLLSLKFDDFSRGLKEVLGLRQQDRLLYLRMHPLFNGINLGDLDALADALQIAHYPAGSLLTKASLALSSSTRPATPTKGQQAAYQQQAVFLLAEGCAAVRRPSSPSNSRASSSMGLRSPNGLYDQDTVCLLQPLDVFGPYFLPPGTYVETVTDTKLYYLTRADYDALPMHMLKLLEESQVFMSQYSAGKQAGLQSIDVARHRPTYGAYQYKVGDVLLTSMNAEAQASLSSLPEADISATTTPKTTPKGSKPSLPPYEGALKSAHGIGKSASPLKSTQGLSGTGRVKEEELRPIPLDVLHAQQVITAMDLYPYKDPHTGLPLPYTAAQGKDIERRKQQPQLEEQQGSPRAHAPGASKLAAGGQGALSKRGSGAMSGGGAQSGEGAGAPPQAGTRFSKQVQSPVTVQSPSQKVSRFGLHVQQQQQQQQQQMQNSNSPHTLRAIDHQLELGQGPQHFASPPPSSPPQTLVLPDQEESPEDEAASFFITQDPLQQHLVLRTGLTRPSSPKRKDHPAMHSTAPPITAGSSSPRVPKLPTLKGAQTCDQASSLTAPLSVLPPNEKAWPRVEIARRQVVETEVPRAQKVPVTLAERHAIIFSKARQVAASTSTSRRTLSSAHDNNSSDEDAPLHTTKQPSRRMSGDRRSSIERRSLSRSANYYDSNSRHQRLVLHNSSTSNSSSSRMQVGETPSSPRASYVGSGGGESGQGRARRSSSSHIFSNEDRVDLERLGVWEGQMQGQADALSVQQSHAQRGQGEVRWEEREGRHSPHSQMRRSSREGRRGSQSGDGSDLGLMMQQEREGQAFGASIQGTGEPHAVLYPPGGAPQPQQQQQQYQQQQQQQYQQQQQLGVAMGGTYQDVGVKGGDPGLPSLQPQEAAEVERFALQQHQVQQQQQQQQQQQLPSQHPSPFELHSHAQGRHRSGHPGVGQSGHGPHDLPPPPLQKGGLVEQAIALPPSVVLGYEALTPFTMASLASYASHPQQALASASLQDNLLPKPNW